MEHLIGGMKRYMTICLSMQQLELHQMPFVNNKGKAIADRKYNTDV